MRIEPRPVQGMGKLSDQPPGRPDRQARIGIQRDDVSDTGRQRGHLTIDRQEGRIGGAAKQAIELVQLAALTLPAHPLLFTFVPDAPAMQKEEPRAILGGSILLVQPGDAGSRFVEQRHIIRTMFRRAVVPVREKREGEIVVLVGEVVNLQPFDLLADRRDAGEQRGHDDDGAQIGRNSAPQFQSGQRRCADELGDRAVHHRDRHVRCRDETGKPQQPKHPAADSGLRYRKERQRENNRRDKRDHAHVAHHADAGIETEQPSA